MDNIGHIEQDCCIEQYSSGGSWLLRSKINGLLQGTLYVFPEKIHNKNGEHVATDYFIGTWDGKKKVHAIKTNTWRGNFGDERHHFFFKWEGHEFWGVQAGDNDIVRCRAYKSEREDTDKG